MKELIKKIIPLKIIDYRISLINEKSYKKWLKDGPLIPTHPVAKQKLLLEYKQKYNLNTLIETGTCYGHTIDALKRNFQKIISIEISQSLFELAKQKFKNIKNISLFLGDSGEMLPTILKDIQEPCLFWLDGHYSDGPTSKGELNTPIFKEIDAVYKSRTDHVILIDDARLFNGEDDYPTLENFKTFLMKHNPKVNLTIKDDIIIITNR